MGNAASPLAHRDAGTEELPVIQSRIPQFALQNLNRQTGIAQGFQRSQVIDDSNRQVSAVPCAFRVTVTVTSTTV
jgi:hypothetical protein